MGIDDAIDAEAADAGALHADEDFERAYRAFVDEATPVFEGN